MIAHSSALIEMTDTSAFEFAVPLEESLAFAELSGDHNPLHVDPVAARRTQFGGTVVHGIHAVLKSADAVADLWMRSGREPVAMSVTFNNPIRSETPVFARVTVDQEGERIKVAARSSGHLAYTLNLTTGSSSGLASVALPARLTLTASQPREMAFPPSALAEEIPLRLDLDSLARLFPKLAATRRPGWIADLLTSTRIVGMECPGLHSIYSGFKLRRLGAGGMSTPALMRYRIDKVDPRFRSARIAVTGSHFEGTLDTVFRLPAVEQRPLDKVAETVESDLFHGQKVLVVGASRGLGEIVAKILLAGGAEVTITYARGLSDAERIQAEALRLGLRCSVRQLDAASPLNQAATDWLTGGNFSHVYFFASPHIEKNISGRWNGEIFERFCDVYVRGFAGLVEALAHARKTRAAPIQFLYPSSVFLDDHEPGFAEYCAAKAAGEALAQHLARQFGTVISAPRLPRMRTDQTSALMDAGTGDPFPVMLDLLRNYRS